MKKLLLLSIFCLLTQNVQAQMPYLEEIKALGTISGQGMACGSAKFDTFEMLARAIMLTKSPGSSTLNNAVYEYNEAKANSYISKQMDGFYQCAMIIDRFDNQEIFKTVLYADGTLKMPDGTIIRPREPYDATLIHAANQNTHIEAKAIYDGAASNLPDNIPAPKIESIRSDISSSMPMPVPQPILPEKEKYQGEDDFTIGHIKR